MLHQKTLSTVVSGGFLVGSDEFLAGEKGFLYSKHMPFVKRKPKLDYRLAVITGAIVAVASYFNWFAIPSSYMTSEGCQKAGGVLEADRCRINDLTLDVKG